MKNNLDALIEELVVSEEFQEHCLHPTDESKLYWSKRQAENPDLKTVIPAARKIVLQLSLRLPENEVTEELAKFRNNLQTAPSGQTVQMLPRRRIFAYAAAACLLIISTFWFFNQSENTVTAWKIYETEYGQTLSHKLPDGTQVTLNANSKLSVPTNWKPGNSRQVKLVGEAFFEVKHTSTDDKFTVQTEKGLITVLGTKFNIQERDGQLEVVLTEGKISLDVKDNSTLFLEPGQMAYVGEDNIVTLKTVESDAFIAWHEHRMVFKDMPISRVVSRLKNDFGLQVIVKNEALSKRQISASIANDDPQVLLDALAAIYDLTITRQDPKTVIIE